MDRSSFSRVLVFQFGAILIFTAAALAAGTFAIRKGDDRGQATRTAIRRINANMRDADNGVQDFTSSRQPSDRMKATTAHAAALDLLRAAQGLTPEAATEADAVRSDLEAMVTLAEAVFAAPNLDDRVAAMRVYDVRAARTYASLDAFEDRLTARSARSRVVTVEVTLALWAGAFLLYLVTSQLARSRFNRAVEVAEAARKHALDVVARQLVEACDGARPSPSTSEALLFPTLARPVNDVVRALHETRETLQRERSRAAFGHHLAEALDLVDAEPEVSSTLSRAASLAFRDAKFQLLLADNSQSELVAQFDDGPRACSPRSPQSCPSIRRGRTLVNRPNGGMARCPQLANEETQVACAFVSVRGRAVGVAQLVGGDATDEHVEMLAEMSFAAGARLAVVRTLGERELQAATDVLTGLANRRAMNERLSRLDRAGTPYAVVSADLDHFKRLNDTYGHEIGDRCLKLFAQVLRDASRADDLAARPGGEEFTVVLAKTGMDGGRTFAARVHGMLTEASRKAGLAFTVSLGVATRPEHGGSAEEVLRAADAALYSAKERGRNRTEVYGETTGPTPLAVVASEPAALAEAPHT